MGTNKKLDLKTEAKLLPFTLGKLLGGAGAVAGFIFGGICLVIRLFYKDYEPDPSLVSIIMFFLLGVTGVVLFLWFDRKIKNKLSEEN